MIAIEDLRIRFGVNEVVRGVSFAVPEGGSFGLVGESGSGKSTILRAVSGLNADWSGRMMIGGTPMTPKRGRDFFRRVQMVFQDPYGSLHPRQTVDRALSEPLIVHGIGDRDARIMRMLSDVALPASARFRYPHQLSGGQRQRVAIARSLMSEPEVLLLDEPTSALDVSVQAEILNLLRDVQQKRRLTVILVSHNLAVTAHMCPTIAVMQAGKIVEVVSSEDLRAGRVQNEHTAELRRLSVELDA